jgi:hypothetical protein
MSLNQNIESIRSAFRAALQFSSPSGEGGAQRDMSASSPSPPRLKAKALPPPYPPPGEPPPPSPARKVVSADLVGLLMVVVVPIGARSAG